MTSISNATLESMIGKTNAATTKAGETYNQFLVLLTTQLQHQDPLDPMESNEFTNQLVQFSQVEQQILSNEKMDTLVAQTNSNQMGQSLSYIGKDVYFNGDSVYYEGDPMKIGYAIDGETKTAKLRIIDAEGNTVRAMDLEAKTTNGSVTWDGKDDLGNPVDPNKVYSVRCDAVSATSAPLKTYTGVPAHVEGVETLDGVLFLALNGARRVEAGKVLSVSEADTVVAPDPVIPPQRTEPNKI